MGKPAVTGMHHFSPACKNADELLALAASVEKGSEHPIGKAIVREASDIGLHLVSPENFVASGGLGVTADIEGKTVRVGKPGWFLETDDEVANAVTASMDKIQQRQSRGETVMVVVSGHTVCGLISVSDKVKPESASAIEALHRMHMKVGMVTGDNTKTARVIAAQVGIDDVFAEVRPEEKAATVEMLQKQGKKVGMVGDGINDAPALAQADVGMAIGSGTDVAIETAGLILSSGSLTGVSRAIRLSKATMRTIRQNLFWAFFYNLTLIPIAAGILYPFDTFPGFLRELHPIMAALAMSISSITVVSNSLRLYSTSSAKAL
jgi:Cu+-exporting ATPase